MVTPPLLKISEAVCSHHQSAWHGAIGLFDLMKMKLDKGRPIGGAQGPQSPAVRCFFGVKSVVSIRARCTMSSVSNAQTTQKHRLFVQYTEVS